MLNSSWTADHGRQKARRRVAGAVGLAIAAGAVLAACPVAHAADSGSAQPVKSAAAAAPTVRELTPAVQARLDRAIKHELRRSKATGVMVGLWKPGRDYVRAFGTAGKGTRAPMSTGFNMRVGSVTKTFTITALLQLVDQKKVRLDDPIAKYVRGVPQGHRITLRQLAEMRSGLLNYMADEEYQKVVTADPNHHFTRDELLAYSFKHGLQSEPGTKFHYSNTNTLLIGKVVEKVSGESIDRFVKRHVIRPAHLRHTFSPKRNEFPAPHARGYTNQTPDQSIVDATHWDPSSNNEAGDMISTMSDLRRWAPMVVRGDLLKPATQKERMRTVPVGIPGLGYGLGVMDNHGWIGHNGGLPGYTTVMVHLPSADATLVVHANSDVYTKGKQTATWVAKAVTDIVSPRNVYDLPAAS
ncbi:serine hydrolase domain-containing protein [Streptomyces sp. NPDC026673]|uniref:serine hydrolase domain-containing protein n=1 Tax=Streptomyces sp. NPDC026673 TaxID=3155724 RepID=UPI0034113C1C